MPSLVDELNELLRRERGEVEAVEMLLSELAETDPDLAESGADVLKTSSWTCSGLYHRITQLHGTPTLDADELAEELSEMSEQRSRIEFVCKSQAVDKDLTKRVLARRDLDKTTRQFLHDVLKAHEETESWCRATLSQWAVEA